jgi:hypothetical protein
VPPGAGARSTIVNGNPASLRRRPATIPDSPHPITTTGDSVRCASGTVSRHVTARESAPSSWSSSIINGTAASIIGRAARNSIISRTNAGEGANASQPRSR